VERLDFWSVLKRGVLCRCPNCGKAGLFKKYLKQVEHCPECNEGFGQIQADDGPAWLTILIVGHLLVPFIVFVETAYNMPLLATFTIWPFLVLILTLAMLPSAKGAFIALIWRTGCVGAK
jgi:uncharacterized protein (DUF983 family)